MLDVLRKRWDWSDRLAFWVGTGVAFVVYLFSLGPSVGLEDSGELVTAAESLGVPHPPGYPLWTMLSWCFCRLFAWVTWQGYPNPAWAVALGSAVMGALATGVTALLITRSGRDLLAHTTQLDGPSRDRIAWGSGVAASLAFALSPVMWSQSVIAEVYALGAFFMALTLLLTYQWLFQPQRKTLVLLGLVFGLGLTNYQVLLLAAVPIGIVVVAREWRLALHYRTVALTLGAAMLGLSLYLYLPLASAFSDSAMNWGEARTWAGFWRVITRGQYEALAPVSEGVTLARQLWEYGADLRAQFSPMAILLAAVGTGLFVWRVVRLRWRQGALWLGCTGLCFFVMSVVLIVLANPTGDLQDVFIQKVKFISSHGIFALWIGYGLMAAAVLAQRFVTRQRRLMAVWWCLAVVIPLMPVYANVMHRELIRMLGAAEQTGHDYGWQFGAYMLNGAPTIRAELSPDEEPLPDPFYPPPMEEGAVFFGGTDPGRFVPTYLVAAADFRSDLLVFTQNALADPTYMNVERDRLGTRMWLPTETDVQAAVWEYAEAVRTGQRPNRGEVIMDADGRVSITGQTAIMDVCETLAQAMFVRNPERSFYIEESHPMRWMKPYLEPAGLALRVNRNGGNVAGLKLRDADFWDWMTRRLVASPGYRRDIAAQKSFTQLRLAYGRLYGLNGLRAEEGRAYQEALALYPLSFATTIKYAQWLTLQPSARHIYNSARMIRRFRAIDPKNGPTREYEAQLREKVEAWQFIDNLVAQPEGYHPSAQEYVRLAKAQVTLGFDEEAAKLWGYLAQQPGLTDAELWDGSRALLMMGRAPTTAYALFCRVSEHFLRAQSPLDMIRCAWMCQEVQDGNRARMCLQIAVERAPTAPEVWAEVMLFYASIQAREEAVEACRKVLQYGSEAMLNARPEYRAAVQWMHDKDGGKP